MRLAPLPLLLMLLAGPLHAAVSPDPLRFITDKADLVIKIENPRKLIETFRSLEAFKQAEQLEGIRQFLDSAPARRFFEFIAYYERDLGTAWPELLNKLAGGGIAIGAKIKDGVDDPVLFVIQGTDEAMLAKFLERASDLLEQELSRSESKDKLTKDRYQTFDTLHFGKDLHLCRVGSALLFANKLEALHAGLDQHLENSSRGGKPAKNMLNSPNLAETRKILPPNPQAWLWYGFNYLKNQPKAKDVLTTPRNDTILTFLFAGYLDVVRRSEFMAAGLYEKKDGYALSIRMPAGREGMAEDVELHLPRDSKATYTFPLLVPKGVIFCHSFYLDLGTLWAKRDKIMAAKNAKDFEKGVKDGSRFLPGASIDKLLMQSGVYHRIVVANAIKPAYTVEPSVKLPAFAVVDSMRDPAFGKSAEALIRSGAFLASTQVDLKLFEEKYGETSIFGYRFPEGGKFPDDPQNIRFNFVPTFAIVQDQFIAASNTQLCKELIDIIRKEDRTKIVTQNMRMQFDAKGGAAFLNAAPEALLTQTILSQAVPEAEAKRQVEQFLKYINGLGLLSLQADYGASEFRFDIEWKRR